MPREPIPDEVRRFILTSIPSVPFVEALLVFMARPGRAIEVREISRLLYVREAAAADIVQLLREGRVVEAVDSDPPTFRYAPATPELDEMLHHVSAFYSKDLIPVTDLIHSRTGRKAQQFADAFKLRKDS